MKILIVDDHQLLCVALSEHLERISARISPTPIIVIPVFSLEAAARVLTGVDPPDFVFLDLNLDDQSAASSTLAEFQNNNPYKVPVAVLTGLSLSEDSTMEILRAALKDFGAKGVLLKNTDLDSAFVGIKRILAGEVWMPHEVLVRLATTTSRSHSPRYHLGLSPREWDVARCLTQGLQDKEIARKLELSPQYVRQVTRQIYEKLDVNSRTKAALRVQAALDLKPTVQDSE